MTANCTFPGEVCLPPSFHAVQMCGVRILEGASRVGQRPEAWRVDQRVGVHSPCIHGCIGVPHGCVAEERARADFSHISPYLPPFDVDEGPAQQLKATLDSAMDLLKPEEGDGHHLMDHGPGKTSPPTMAPWSWWRV
eukprot:CAMPEP_0185317920 /NCGR_PEP_ID=MMETSP1363-20130426/48040_1 /TAXON_ID=38817 /ORGANISM="Gephyrocapsa oceanica, Strain RCC1303" /LENGTH=136 /DNA_ID=CAMNT_0027916183 /DNA_START=123 /DNA_END=534 /DNA_ORIENTATION=-